jgi:hypothetical protein
MFKSCHSDQLSGGRQTLRDPDTFEIPFIYLLASTAFQADDEGSIPFTRSNVFLDHATRFWRLEALRQIARDSSSTF